MNAKGFSWKKFWSDMGNRKFIFLLAVGLILAMLVFPASSSEEGIRETETQPAVQDAQSAQSYAAELENRLEEVLSTIEGAGRVEVMVTISASSEQVLQNDLSRQESVTRETDAQGGVRDNYEISEDSQTVLYGEGNGEPYVVKELMPQVEGVVVSCEGGDRASIQAEISAAVQALFDIPTHKIKVCKMASQP